MSKFDPGPDYENSRKFHVVTLFIGIWLTACVVLSVYLVLQQTPHTWYSVIMAELASFAIAGLELTIMAKMKVDIKSKAVSWFILVLFSITFIMVPLLLNRVFFFAVIIFIAWFIFSLLPEVSSVTVKRVDSNGKEEISTEYYLGDQSDALEQAKDKLQREGYTDIREGY